MHFPTDSEDGIKTVRVVCLRLSPHGGSGKLTFEVPRGAPETLYELSSEWFGHHDPLQSGFRVQHAKLAVEFHPEPGTRRGKVLGVELTAPHRCNLKNRTRHERLIGEKYLERWKLLEAV
jgi:hypothetical protein